MRALREPRNWVPPVVAVGVGGVATGALVLFELRRRGKAEASGLKGLAEGLRERLEQRPAVPYADLSRIRNS